MRLHYGVWDGVVYDNRGTADYKEPEGLDLKNLLQFNNCLLYTSDAADD